MADDSEDECLGLLFPAAPQKDEAAGLAIKYDEYMRQGGETLTLALVKKHHSLWAEFIYNAARILADRIDAGLIDCRGKHCLELGAGAGLPGLMAALNGANISVITDYGTPHDHDLVDVIHKNIAALADQMPQGTRVEGMGFIFGNTVEPLLALAGGRRFDRVLMADLVFNRSEHAKLLSSLRACLAPGGEGWVAFSHHDPGKTALDLAFFDLARNMGFCVLRVGEEVRESYPFVQKDGLDGKRGVVNIYLLTLVGTAEDGGEVGDGERKGEDA